MENVVTITATATCKATIALALTATKKPWRFHLPYFSALKHHSFC